VTKNPFVGVAVEVPRKAETSETGKAFTDVGAALALSAIPQTKSGRIVLFF
jgi:hypothetical protein